MKGFLLCLSWALLLAVAPLQAAEDTGMMDLLALGDEESEKAHHFQGQSSEKLSGLLEEPARRLLPRDPVNWEGGTISFVLKVDPAKQNYLTIKLSGSEVNRNHHLLFIDGKQIGYRHLGDIPSLDAGSEQPFYNGRFFYSTCPLPLALTKGKTELAMEIRASGPIGSYASNFEKYQGLMKDLGRCFYRVYTHTEACFLPPADEKQGKAPAETVRTSPGEEVLEAVKSRVLRAVRATLQDRRSPDQNHILFLARAYHTKWTPAFQNPKAIEVLQAGIDGLFLAFRNNPDLASSDPTTYNPDWFGFGPTGWALALVAEQITPSLDKMIKDEAGQPIRRREAYAEMFAAARDWNLQHRRSYTNQAMINDLYGVYLANRGLQIVAPERAMPEEKAVRYLHEAVGLLPWLGPEKDGVPTKPLGDNFFQTTQKGLTRELGYVGTYGEVIDWVAQIYEATRSPANPDGDAKIKAHLVKISRARAAFRYPSQDAEGHRAMRLETVIGWCDVHFPGPVTYAQRQSWDGTPLEAAVATGDPHLVGYARQMLEDNQFFSAVEEMMKEPRLRVTSGLLPLIDQYEALKALPESKHRLPMGGADFVFADEEDGVVAVKHGKEIFYASLYWRARSAVNNLAKVHLMTPEFDRVGVVAVQTKFTHSGTTWKRPNWTNFGFANGGPHYPGKPQSAHAGEELPIAAMPPGVIHRPGKENWFAGKADFYELRYGPYLIGMNTTTGKTFDLKGAAGLKDALDLTSGKVVEPGAALKVRPRSTLVLRVKPAND